jgi:hypothetical protein
MQKTVLKIIGRYVGCVNVNRHSLNEVKTAFEEGGEPDVKAPERKMECGRGV